MWLSEIILRILLLRKIDNSAAQQKCSTRSRLDGISVRLSIERNPLKKGVLLHSGASQNQSARAQRMIETLKTHLLQSRQFSLF